MQIQLVLLLVPKNWACSDAARVMLVPKTWPCSGTTRVIACPQNGGLF